MPFEIVRNDITNMHVDAIVNSANPRPIVGLGTDSSIHKKAGPELLAARKKIGPIARGQAAITPAFGLSAKYVIHTVGPVWAMGSYGEESLLRSCYDQSLKLALQYDCKSIAFPLIATNNYGFPRDKALQIAVASFSEFLLEHEMMIYLVVFDRKAFKLSEKLFHSIESYIDDNYVAEWETATYGSQKAYRQSAIRRRQDLDLYRQAPSCAETAPCAPMPKAELSRALSLKDLLQQADAGFSETLLKLIDKSGQKDSAVYKKACLTKQHFSKIRNNPDYKPTKQTAIALALALELDLEATRDLIGRAGYALSNSSKFDLIIRYFIEQKNYNVVEINIALYEFDQSLLGS
ncbi:MAG: macro domain-containing protein [Oscillospiraceae bacterium]|nr:macro domain-containing protein [Oscillospiraceae bacterium]